MRTAQATLQPGWLASQADMLADDWQEVYTREPINRQGQEDTDMK
jgi:hypothetical protein